MKIDFPKLALPPRVELLPDVVFSKLDQINLTLESFGLRIPQGALADELLHLSCGARVKSEVEHDAEIQYLLNSAPPFWLKMMFPLRKLVARKIIDARMNSLRIFQALSEVDPPGYSIEQKYISVVVYYFLLIHAQSRYKIAPKLLAKQLSHVVSISKMLDEYETALLDSLPTEKEMAEFPELLQRQFDKEGLDGEIYFAGEEANVIYALSRAVQALKTQKSFSKRKQEEGSASEHLVVTLDLLKHAARYLILSTSRKLERFSAFALVKRNKFFIDPDGDEFEQRPMESLGEISRISPRDFVFLSLFPDYFRHRLVTLDFQIREAGRTDEVREVSYVMIDKSPSTLVQGRWCKAFGILFNRMLGIIKSDAIVVLQFFDNEVEKPISVTNFDEAMSILKLAKVSTFVGSGTDINNAIRTGLARLKNVPKSMQFKLNLIIVTDGKDNVDVELEELGQVCLHAFIVADENKELQNLCFSSGGIYMNSL